MGNEAENKLIVNMLGGFSVVYDGHPVSLGKVSVSKALELFQMLMLRVKNGIPKNKILQSLYSWESVHDKNRSMNSLLYRLKQQLMEAGIVHDEYVVIKNAVCRWTEDIPAVVDTVEFEEAMTMAQEAGPEKKEEFLWKAFGLYKGELLPSWEGKSWVIEERVRLKKIYTSCIQQLGDLLAEKQEYQKMFDVYSQAAELYPFDEWQLYQIESLQKMERFEDAYELYQNTVQKYFDELGLPPSEKMLNKIHNMSECLLNRDRDLADIKEILAECAETKGAYYCTYPSFVDIYRYVSRTIERSGQSVFFMVCTVQYLDPTGRRSPKAGDLLLKAIEGSLRKGDIFARYSNHQFLILLTGTQNENCEMIFERIRRAFKKANRNSNCDLEYNISELLDIPESSEPIRFKRGTVKW